MKLNILTLLFISIFVLSVRSQFVFATGELTESDWAVIHDVVKPFGSEISILRSSRGKELQNLSEVLGKQILEKIPDLGNRPSAIPELTRFIIELLFEDAPPPRDSLSSGLEVNSRFSFPCDLDHLVYRPKFEIIGDYHTRPEDREGRLKLIKRACEGELYLGIEGYSFENRALSFRECEYLGVIDYFETSRIFGIEDEFLHALTFVLNIYFSLVDFITLESSKYLDFHYSKQNVLQYIIQVSDQIKYNPFIRRAWNKIQRPLINLEYEEVASWIDSFLLLEDKIQLEISFIKDTKSQLILTNTSAFISILHHVIEQLAELLKTTESRTYGFSWSDYLQVLNYPLHHLVFLPNHLGVDRSTLKPHINLGYQITVESRNLPFAKHAAHLYCQASKENKDLTLILGQLHTEAVYQLLLEAGSGLVLPTLRNYN